MVNAYSTRNASAFMAPFAKDATGDGSFPSNYAYPGPESGKLTRKQLEGFYVGWMTDFVPRTGGMPNPSISVMIDKREDKGDLATVSGVIYVIMPLQPNGGGNMDGYFAFVDQWSKSGGQWLLKHRTQKDASDAQVSAFENPQNASKIINAKG